jgi:hypothetical protein
MYKSSRQCERSGVVKRRRRGGGLKAKERHTDKEKETNGECARKIKASIKYVN